MGLKKVTVVAVLLLACGSVHGQYQKLSKSWSINVSGFPDYINGAYSYQIDNHWNFLLGGYYWKDAGSRISTNNYVGNLGFSRWFFRVGDIYLVGGSRFFIMHTSAKSAAGTSAGDTSFGFDFGGELEFYLSWRIVIFAEIKEMIIFASDFYNNNLLGGGGLKLVF